MPPHRSGEKKLEVGRRKGWGGSWKRDWGLGGRRDRGDCYEKGELGEDFNFGGT